MRGLVMLQFTQFITCSQGLDAALGALDAVVTSVNNVQHRATSGTPLLFSENNMLQSVRG